MPNILLIYLALTYQVPRRPQTTCNTPTRSTVRGVAGEDTLVDVLCRDGVLNPTSCTELVEGLDRNGILGSTNLQCRVLEADQRSQVVTRGVIYDLICTQS